MEGEAVVVGRQGCLKCGVQMRCPNAVSKFCMCPTHMQNKHWGSMSHVNVAEKLVRNVKASRRNNYF